MLSDLSQNIAVDQDQLLDALYAATAPAPAQDEVGAANGKAGDAQ